MYAGGPAQRLADADLDADEARDLGLAEHRAVEAVNNLLFMPIGISISGDPRKNTVGMLATPATR